MSNLPSLSAESRRWWRLPVEWWWQSLPLRVILSVFGASVLVLVLGGFLLMRQASIGVMEAKRDSVSIEARQALDAAQQQLNSADLTGDPNPDKKLTELALGFANRSGGSDQYDVIIISGGQTITAGDVSPASIPDTLRSQVATSDDLLMTPTEVIYRDDTPAVAGIAVGSGLTLPGTGRYEIYFIFPLTQQMNILAVLQTAVVSTGAILVVLLTFIAALVARQVVVPIRAARRAAESLASGNLDDRMKVRGRDDLARLATSMNYMASELQKQISQLEELSRVQQRFVSDVSHELRTPLTTVRMAAEVLYETREDFDPIAARSAELLQTELDRFEALLTDLLEISRFDAGAAVLAVSEVDLRDVVSRVVDASEQLARTQWLRDPGARARTGRTPRSTPAGSSGCCATCWSTPSSTARADRSTSWWSPTTTRSRWRSATTGSGSRPVRPSRCSTGSGGPTRPGPGRSAAPVWAWPSRWRTPTCTRGG